MKRFLVIPFLGLCLTVGGQTVNLNYPATATQVIPSTRVKKGETLILRSVSCDMSQKKGYEYILTAEDSKGNIMDIEFSKWNNIPFTIDADTKDKYWHYRTMKYSLPSLSRISNAYSLRSKAEQNANEYVKKLKDASYVVDDPYLTAYVNSLLLKINPSRRLDGFKYNYRVVIVKANEPNAGIYPNGALLINAGLLARLHTEDELVALLCHEANHFICNHYLENKAKQQVRETIGMVTGAVAGVAAGIFTRSVSTGLLTATVATDISSDINKVITSFGLSFNQSQEIESDQAAVDILPILGYDGNGMATLINRIGDYYKEEGDLNAYYKSGSHPKIEKRIEATGIPYDRIDSDFEQKVASCVSYVGQINFNNARYEQALKYVNQNIDNNVARGIDYYIKGECLLTLADSEESNREAEQTLLKALDYLPNSSSALKSLIVAHLRLREINEAKTRLCELMELSKDNTEDYTWAQSMLLSIDEYK